MAKTANSSKGRQSVYHTVIEEVNVFSRCWELDESPQQIVDIQGRLHERVKFWEEVLQASPQIMNYIVEGYKFPQLSLPLSL